MRRQREAAGAVGAKSLRGREPGLRLVQSLG